jgi:hypothetical protein
MSSYDANIEAAWAASTESDLARGLEWYRQARSEGRALGRTVAQGVGVIAALSPMQAWDTNIELAYKLAATHAAGKSMPTRGYGFKKNTAKAWRILNGERPLDVLGGDKVRSFYRNMLGCADSVTVDRWAVRIALGDPQHSGTVPSGQYAAMSDAFRRVAARHGVTARDLQAATWIWIRREHGRTKPRDPKHWTTEQEAA